MFNVSVYYLFANKLTWTLCLFSIKSQQRFVQLNILILRIFIHYELFLDCNSGFGAKLLHSVLHLV